MLPGSLETIGTELKEVVGMQLLECSLLSVDDQLELAQRRVSYS